MEKKSSNPPTCNLCYSETSTMTQLKILQIVNILYVSFTLYAAFIFSAVFLLMLHSHFVFPDERTAPSLLIMTLSHKRTLDAPVMLLSNNFIHPQIRLSPAEYDECITLISI